MCIRPDSSDFQKENKTHPKTPLKKLCLYSLNFLLLENQNAQRVFTPSLPAYGLYTCENIDNCERLRNCSHSFYFSVNFSHKTCNVWRACKSIHWNMKGKEGEVEGHWDSPINLWDWPQYPMTSFSSIRFLSSQQTHPSWQKKHWCKRYRSKT